jgi:hypothetical protein
MERTSRKLPRVPGIAFAHIPAQGVKFTPRNPPIQTAFKLHLSRRLPHPPHQPTYQPSNQPEFLELWNDPSSTIRGDKTEPIGCSSRNTGARSDAGWLCWSSRSGGRARVRSHTSNTHHTILFFEATTHPPTHPTTNPHVPRPGQIPPVRRRHVALFGPRPRQRFRGGAGGPRWRAGVPAGVRVSGWD